MIVLWFQTNFLGCLFSMTQTVEKRNWSSLENINELLIQRQQDSLCLPNFGSFSAFSMGLRTQSALTYRLKLTCLSESLRSFLWKLFWREARFIRDLHTLFLTATTSSLSMTCYYLYFYLSTSVVVLGIEAKAWPILKSLC